MAARAQSRTTSVSTIFIKVHRNVIDRSSTIKQSSKSRVKEDLTKEEDKIGELGFSSSIGKEARKLAPEVRIKQIGMREDLLSIIRHTSSDHFSEEL